MGQAVLLPVSFKNEWLSLWIKDLSSFLFSENLKDRQVLS